MEKSIDAIRRVAAPEVCKLNLYLAGPVTRAQAFFIDLLIRFALFVAVQMMLGRFFGGMGMGLSLVLYFALAWLYPVIFEVLNRGATPGKRLHRIAVLRDDGTPVDWDAAFLRNALRFLDGMPVGYAAALVIMGLNQEGKRLGDILAGTVVVHLPESPPVTQETMSSRSSRRRSP